MYSLLKNIYYNIYFSSSPNEISYKEMNKLSNITKINIINDEATIYNSQNNNIFEYKYIIGNYDLFNDFIVKKSNNINIKYIKQSNYIYDIFIEYFIFIIFSSLVDIILDLFDTSEDNKNSDSILDNNIKLKDVVGLDEVKEEINEFIDILRNHTKYVKMKCKVPRGILFYGPPGTGKTLMAKALANESQVGFIHACGSSFNEVYIGVGQSRIKKLFKSARRKKKCIIFIDEIDTLGRKRSSNVNSGHNENDNTLNRLLSEMDGINSNKNILVIGATNKPDLLDEALLRAGRFDRKIEFNLPNLNERSKIFSYYLNKYPIVDNIENLSKELSNKTFGLSSAELSNICNEAAIKTIKNNKDKIDIDELNGALEYVIVGNKRLSSKLSNEDKEIVAYHEAGHAFMSYIQKNVESPSKISIIPTTKGALGFSLTPSNEKKLISKDQILEEMSVLLGGRCSENVFLKKISTGASNDLEKLKQMQLSFIKIYGFSDKYTNINLDIGVSDYTKKLIDNDIFDLNNDLVLYTENILRSYRNEIKLIANKLITNEEINNNELKEILGENLENSVKFSKKNDYRFCGI